MLKLHRTEGSGINTEKKNEVFECNNSCMRNVLHYESRGHGFVPSPGFYTFFLSLFFIENNTFVKVIIIVSLM